MTQVSVLEIQLSTYKEDFQMERKDREAAQDRVIKLEQELSDLARIIYFYSEFIKCINSKHYL